MSNIEELKKLIYEQDNRACFIERENLLSNINIDDYPFNLCSSAIFSKLLDNVFTPINENDVFLGRVVEEVPESREGMPSCIIYSPGHMSFNYEELLKKGLSGILEEVRKNLSVNDIKSMNFYLNSEIVVNAIKKYCDRYAKDGLLESKKLDGVKAENIKRAANALKYVPYEPAYDFYSALASIWIIHMIASCYIGERDFAFGRMDQYLYPYYKNDIEKGVITKDEAVEIIAYFCLKTNEICGRSTHNYMTKPILPHASKQYICIGGVDKNGDPISNELSCVILKGAQLANMPQPVITVLYNTNSSDKDFAKQIFSTLSVLQEKMQVYNDSIMPKMLMSNGVPEDIAYDYSYSACTNIDLHYRTLRSENYQSQPEWLCEVLGISKDKTKDAVEFDNIEDILNALRKITKEKYQIFVDYYIKNFGEIENNNRHILNGLLIGECAKRNRYPGEGGLDYILFNLYINGIATVADSLSALDTLVFKEKLYTYNEFIDILSNDFKGYEDLQLELKNKFPKFGNNSNVDDYAVMAANAFIDGINALTLPKNIFAIPGFYSLDQHNQLCKRVPATPDGRSAFTPYSENQSPVYGCDTEGLTSLLNSIAKLPFHKTGCGGLNVTLSSCPTPEILEAIYNTYFNSGGFHIGMSIINRDTLKDAMVNPDKYKSLTVRLYGFSEFFVALPEWQQVELLNRTVNSVNN